MWWVELLNSITAILDAGSGGGGGAYESIATATLGSNAASVSFTSFVGTYKDLQIRGFARTTKAAVTDVLQIQVNGDSSAAYPFHRLFGNGSTASASGSAATNWLNIAQIAAGNATSSVFGSFVIDLSDYASTTKNKTFRALSGIDNNGSGEVSLYSGFYNSTTAINRIDLIAGSGNLLAGSTFSLYGIKGA